MTFKELLQQCANGEMPKVLYNGKVCQVVTIKNGDGYNGVGVNTGNNYTDWFHAESGTDKRKKYMSELSVVDAQTAQKNEFAIPAVSVNEKVVCDHSGVNLMPRAKWEQTKR